MPGTRQNPKRLALWSIAGSMFAACTFFTVLLPAAATHRRSFLYVIVIQLFTGFALSMMAARRLKSNYRLRVWTEEEVTPARALLALPLWAWLGTSMFAIGLLIVCFTKHNGVFIGTTILMLTVVSDMRKALTPSTPEERSIGLENLKPLYSNHWGEVPQG